MVHREINPVPFQRTPQFETWGKISLATGSADIQSFLSVLSRNTDVIRYTDSVTCPLKTTARLKDQIKELTLQE